MAKSASKQSNLLETVTYLFRGKPLGLSTSLEKAIELNSDLFDKHLIPFWRTAIESGTHDEGFKTRESLIEMLLISGLEERKKLSLEIHRIDETASKRIGNVVGLEHKTRWSELQTAYLF